MSRQSSLTKITSISKILSSLSAILLLIVSHNASATLINLEATIDKNQVVGTTPVTSATGFATMTFDDITNQLDWNIVFSNLTGAATAMHFHGAAAAGVNAGVQVNIGAISGLTSPSIGLTTLTDLQETDLLNGLWYINIHTAAYGGGEIRGQVLETSRVPEPSTLLLFGAALAGLSLTRKKVINS